MKRLSLLLFLIPFVSAIAQTPSVAEDQWRVVHADRMQIREGSALDLSENSALPRLPDGTLPRLKIREDGKLSARLMGFNCGSFFQFPRSPYPQPTREEITSFARAVRRQGYNAIRFFDADLLCTEKDLLPNEERFALLDHLLAELGRNGIYCTLPIAAYRIFRKDSVKARKNRRFNDTKLRMYLGDPETRRAWESGTRMLLNRRNSCNGKLYRDDTTIGVLEFWNELEGGLIWGGISPETQQLATEKFREYLQRKYPSRSALKQAVGLESPEEIRVPSRMLGNLGKAPLDREFLLFTGSLARECFDWCESVVRAAGYRGLTAQYDVPHWINNLAVRYEKSPVALSHKYFAHPYLRKGRYFCSQQSCVHAFAQNFLLNNASRYADRPHLITEYCQPCWNRYQFEAGPLFGAYGALQGTDGLFIHESAVLLVPKRGSYPYSFFHVGSNPVLRAGEFIANMLYLRGDAKRAPFRIDLTIPREATRLYQGLSLEQIRLALLCGFAITFPDLPRPPELKTTPVPAVLTIPMQGKSKDAGFSGGWSAELKEDGKSAFDMNSLVADLKKRNLLPAENRTNPDAGLFESCTGELLLDSPGKTFRVITDRTEVITMEKGRKELPGFLRQITLSEAGCFAVISRDRRPLRESRRLVLVYSTRVANTGMEWDKTGEYLLKRGTLPVRMKTGRFHAVFSNPSGRKFRCYALNLSGERMEELPLHQKGNRLTVSADTSRIKEISPFFELVAEENHHEE